MQIDEQKIQTEEPQTVIKITAKERTAITKMLRQVKKVSFTVSNQELETWNALRLAFGLPPLEHTTPILNQSN